MMQRPVVNLNEIELMPQSPQKPEAGFEAVSHRSRHRSARPSLAAA